MKIRIIRFFLLAILILSLTTANCFKNNVNAIIPDLNLQYSNPSLWASLPSITDKQVDVFYVYPTLFGGTNTMNMDIFDENMRDRVQNVLLKQSSIFENDCNIFVPYYQQMAMDGLFLGTEEQKKYFEIGVNDIEHAFEYYLENLNDGRPFILAGHSQGSQVLLHLMKTKLSNPDLMDKLVAAYLIGYSITASDISQYDWLKIASSSNDLGVIITYNTQSKDAKGSPVLLPNAMCINPLNWKNTSVFAKKNLHLGAVFFDDSGNVDSIVNNFTGAYISDNGALIVDIENDKKYNLIGFPKGVFHKYDYSFFYYNLQQNVAVRISSYLKNKTYK